MEEIRSDEIEQVSGGTYQQTKDLQDFLDRFFRERVSYPMPVRDPVW